jgi:uncharacterized damage-inducible protein DinB
MTNPNPHTFAEIYAAAEEAFQHCQQLCERFSEEAFQESANDKWSAAQNLDHLIRSTEPLTQGLNLPTLAFKALGRPNRPVRSYEEVVARYHTKLEEGAVATGPYVAKEEPGSQKQLLDKWQKASAAFLKIIKKKWDDEAKLNKFLLPHPLLGKIMVREMFFFTIYHTWHHSKAIEEILNSSSISSP